MRRPGDVILYGCQVATSCPGYGILSVRQPVRHCVYPDAPCPPRNSTQDKSRTLSRRARSESAATTTTNALCKLCKPSRGLHSGLPRVLSRVLGLGPRASGLGVGPGPAAGLGLGHRCLGRAGAWVGARRSAPTFARAPRLPLHRAATIGSHGSTPEVVGNCFLVRSDGQAPLRPQGRIRTLHAPSNPVAHGAPSLGRPQRAA